MVLRLENNFNSLLGCFVILFVLKLLFQLTATTLGKHEVPFKKPRNYRKFYANLHSCNVTTVSSQMQQDKNMK